jgi:hypothetical protein
MSGSLRPALTLALAAMVLGGIMSVAPPGASAQDRSYRRSSDREFNQRVRRADPGKVVATELAFARAAQEKGQWTAFADFAADDAVMFVPEPVNAKEWLRKQQDPAQAVRWQPHQVWSSCDGTLAVTKGAWQRPDGSTGYFTTVWERQRNGEYEWVLDQGDTLEQPLPAIDMIASSVAVCGPARPEQGAVAEASVAADDRRSGVSRDSTLIYSTDVRANGSRTLVVRRWNGSDYEEVLRSEVAARG